MKTIAANSLAEEILRASKEEAHRPFPSHDCETLARLAGVDYQSLVSDLDTYFYDIWSPSNGVKKLPQKSDTWLHDLKTYLEMDFFSMYAKYAFLEALINQDDTPELCRRLMVFDKLRNDLVLFLSELFSQQKAFTKNGY